MELTDLEWQAGSSEGGGGVGGAAKTGCHGPGAENMPHTATYRNAIYNLHSSLGYLCRNDINNHFPRMRSVEQ